MKNVLRTLLILSVFMVYSQTAFCAVKDSSATELSEENPVADVSKTTEDKSDARKLLEQTLLGGVVSDAPSTDTEAQDEENNNELSTNDSVSDDENNNELSTDDSVSDDENNNELSTDDSVSDDENNNELSTDNSISDDENNNELSSNDSVSDDDSKQASEAEVTAFVGNLTDEQVVALNLSLNNALNNERLPDTTKLIKLFDEDFNSKQINTLTKALEEETKFLALYNKTGNEKFQERATTQREKFLSKIEKFQGNDDIDDPLTDDLQDMANNSAKEISKEAAKAAAKDMAKEAAKQSAKQAARESIKESIKEVARTTKKERLKVNQAERKAAKAEKVKPGKKDKPEKAKPAKKDKPEKAKPEKKDKPEKGNKK
ncbi:MAG: hypothetical protein D3924_10820 [Candidatus Electrothrix sp. AR4]|nr:hypothetical protein [Candidatus Electrothrix sp. AR4]